MPLFFGWEAPSTYDLQFEELSLPEVAPKLAFKDTGVIKFSFFLQIDTKVPVIQDTCNNVQDFIGNVGGMQATYTLFLIVIPAGYLIPTLFLTFVVDFIYEQEKKKDDTVTKEQIKEKYLTRVTYIGIYNLYDSLDELKQKCERQQKEIDELKSKLR